MSFTVKEIINDAYDRSGVFPCPSDSLPGEMFAMGYKLLQGLIQTYNIRSYITSTQRMTELKVPADGVLHLARTEEGVEPAIEDVAAVCKLYLVNSEGANTEFKFTSFMNFPKYSQGSHVYTWNQAEEYAYDVYVQKWLAGRKVLVGYVVPFACEVDTKYFLPPEYKELFTLGLCIKLLGVYPREDKTMLESMGGELQNLTGAIEAKQADAKLIEWNTHDFVSRQAAFESGSFLGVY